MRDLFETCLRLGSLTKASPGIVCTAIATLAGCSSVLAASGSTTTTIYVGRHFEARDHDQPTKYVFNGATRVASITGSLSTNTRSQRLRLYPGWNLCSIAVTGLFPVSGGDLLSAAYRWKPATGDYSPVAPGQILSAGTVLWLKAKTNATIAVIGAYADPTSQQVQSGGAYVPSTGLEAWTPSFPPTLSAWLYDPETNQWHEQLDGDLAFISNLPPTLSPGQALYVQTASTVSLNIPDPALRIRYYHRDHLGSSSVITDASGAIVEETAYYPFGEQRNEYRLRQIEEHYTFTEKERDRESGLLYFEARYLAPGLARFISADPLDKPEGSHAYTYAANNPVKYTDPSGLDPTWKVQAGATHSGGLLEGPNSLELSGSLSDASTTGTPWAFGSINYKNQIRIGGTLASQTTGMDFLSTGSLGFKGYAHGQYSYSPDDPHPNWVLQVPFDVSTRGGIGLNGLSYSGSASAPYRLGHLKLGSVSMSFHGSGLSVPEYSWSQYGIGFYPKINAGSLPVPPPEQAFNSATKMDWGQGIGPTARYVRQWPTSRLELAAGFGVGLNEQNMPQFTGLYGRLSYTWGQPRSWERLPSELSQNAGVP